MFGDSEGSVFRVHFRHRDAAVADSCDTCLLCGNWAVRFLQDLPCNSPRCSVPICHRIPHFLEANRYLAGVHVQSFSIHMHEKNLENMHFPGLLWMVSTPARTPPTQQKQGSAGFSNQSTPKSTPQLIEMVAACLGEHLTAPQVADLIQASRGVCPSPG